MDWRRLTLAAQSPATGNQSPVHVEALPRNRIGSYWIAWLCVAVVLPQAAAQSPALRDALASMQRGDFQAAEPKLRGEVAAHPDDPSALTLLGVTLDNLNRIPEASEFHRRAVALSPHSTDVLNNYAAHAWLSGSLQEARKVYLQVVGVDPTHYSANLQLARLALKQGQGPDALRYLDHVPAVRRNDPQVLLLRLEASYLAGNRTEGDTLSARLSEMAKTDLNLSFAAATALSNARQYEKAEMFCEAALQAYPSNFNVLYDLGVMATYAGHYARAREVLEAALRQQPQSVDVLYALARADEAVKQWEAAVRLLAQSAKLDPRRAEIQELLAVTAAELGAFDDSLAAWDRYLQLQPGNEIAQRERSYTAAQMGQIETGIAGIEQFLASHPRDAVAHYELGQAERGRDVAKALMHFDKAVELDPGYLPARTARGSLYYQEGKPEAAVKDLEAAAAGRPDDAAGLDRLGQTYQALDRTADAVRVLRRAAQLAPEDSKTLLHFARALADAGKVDESKAVMDRFRQLGPDKYRQVPAGFVEYLNLTEEQRHADYRARVEKELHNRPDDPSVRLAWLKLLLESGNSSGVAEAARGIAAMKPNAAVLADAGHALLAAKQYSLAYEVLQQAAASAPSAEIQLDLAVTLFRGGDSPRALRQMERLPESARGGDYYLALAEMLSASNQNAEAHAATDRALAMAPPRADFFLRATAFLARNQQAGEALRFLDEGSRALPGSREILLLRACALEMKGRGDEADHVLTGIQSRWPEWYPAWAAHGIILKTRNPEASRRKIETAAALGAPPDTLRLDLESILEGAFFR